MRQRNWQGCCNRLNFSLRLVDYVVPFLGLKFGVRYLSHLGKPPKDRMDMNGTPLLALVIQMCGVETGPGGS